MFVPFKLATATTTKTLADDLRRDNSAAKLFRQKGEERPMDFTLSNRQREWLDRVSSFMEKHVRPAVPVYKQQDAEGERWKVIPIVEELKAKAKAEGLWNMFMPPSSHEDEEFHGAGLSNLEYALLAEQMGHIGWASEVFNCSAPDTGNMEVFMRYGSKEHKQKWLKPLMNGEIRSAFLMTEPNVASSDATNIETSIVRDGDEYVINGTKWWSSGMGDPRCKIMIVMGKTDPSAPKHQQQSQILVPSDTKGVIVEKMLPVFGFDDAPHGHARVKLDNVRVPASNILLGEGRGFEIAQGRLGPGRIHHCMRTIGKAEEALEKMVKRLSSRTAFGKKIIEYSIWEQRIAEARTDIEMNRLLCLKAADMMDKVGNKTAQLEIAMIKVSGPNMALKIIDNAIQAYGAAGVSDDAGLARDYASMRTMRLADGPDEVHNRAIARLELRKYANAPDVSVETMAGRH
jgi:acyl-CoA dehydrogenase